MNYLKPTTSHHPVRGLTIDKDYYIHGADLHFQVEQTLFRVHGYFFLRESSRFRERMAGGECARTHAGISDDTAIPVKGTSPKEFSQFLWVFYNPTYIYSAPVSAWRTILILSSPKKWDFPKVHALALNQLRDLPLPIFDRIALYKTCSVPIEYLIPLYAGLCLREEPLTLGEAVKLGWELTVLVSQVRERLLRGAGRDIDNDQPLAGMSLAPGGVTRDQVEALVTTVLSANEEQSPILGLRGTQEDLHLKMPCDQVHLAELCARDGATMKAKGKRKQFPGSPFGEGHEEMGGAPQKLRSQTGNQGRGVFKDVLGSFKGKVKFGAPA